MAKLTTEQAMLRAKSHEKKGEIDQARTLYQVVLDAFPNNKRARQALASLEKPKPILSDAINPSQEELNALTTLYKRGQLT